MINLREFSSGENDGMVFSLVRQPKVPEGEYRYRIKGFVIENNVLTQYGVRDQVTIKYSVKHKDGRVELSERMYLSDNTESRFRQFIKAYCVAYGTGKIGTDDIIGSKGRLTVEHHTDVEGNVFERISNIRPKKPVDYVPPTNKKAAIKDRGAADAK